MSGPARRSHLSSAAKLSRSSAQAGASSVEDVSRVGPILRGQTIAAWRATSG